jgi:hypothetical protein
MTIGALLVVMTLLDTEVMTTVTLMFMCMCTAIYDTLHVVVGVFASRRKRIRCN